MTPSKRKPPLSDEQRTRAREALRIIEYPLTPEPIEPTDAISAPEDEGEEEPRKEPHP